MKKLLLLILLTVAAVAANAQHGNFTDIRLANGNATLAGTNDGTVYYDKVGGLFQFRQAGSWLALGGSGGYVTVQNAGSSLTQRSNLNFLNGLTAVDNSGNTRTDVSLGGPLAGNTSIGVNGNTLSFNATGSGSIITIGGVSQDMGNYIYAGSNNGYKLFGYYSNSIWSLKESSSSGTPSNGTGKIRVSNSQATPRGIIIDLIGDYSTPTASGFRLSSEVSAVATERMSVDLDGNISILPSGTAPVVGQFLKAATTGGKLVWATASGSGSVVSVSGVNSNNVTFSISNPTTIPVITLSTTGTPSSSTDFVPKSYVDGLTLPRADATHDGYLNGATDYVRFDAATSTRLVSNGGTGITSYTIGDILYASGTGTLSKLAAGTLNYVLTSGGPGVAPSWAVGGGGSGWALTGTSTLTGTATIVSNAANQHVFNGTWTATAATDYHMTFAPAITGASGLGAKALYLNPAFTAVGTSGLHVALDINSTITGGTTPLNVGLRVQGGKTVFGGAFTPLSADVHDVLIRNDNNLMSGLTIVNNVPGTAAGAEVMVSVSSTLANYMKMQVFSSSYTTAGVQIPISAVLSSLGLSGGMSVGTYDGAALALFTGGVKRLTIGATGLMTYNQPLLTSGWAPGLTFIPGSHTGMTANTPFVTGINVSAANHTWIDGTVPSQFFNYIGPVTVLGTTTLATLTEAISLRVDAPAAGSKGAITTPYAIWSNGNLKVTGTSTVSSTAVIGGTTITSGSVLADFQSTTLGVLMPRVTNVAAVTTPVNGMIVYDAATNLFNFRENGSWTTSLVAFSTTSLGYVTASGSSIAILKGNNTWIAPTTTGQFLVYNGTAPIWTTIFPAAVTLATGTTMSNHSFPVTGSDVTTLSDLQTWAQNYWIGSYSSTTTISIVQNAISWTGTTGTLTLPASAAISTGKFYIIKNRGSGTVAISRGGTDNIYDTSSVTSINIAAGASMTLVWDGNFWTTN